MVKPNAIAIAATPRKPPPTPPVKPPVTTAVPVPKNTKIIVPINSAMYLFMLVLLIYLITNIMELLSQGAHITFIIIYKFSAMSTIFFDIIV